MKTATTYYALYDLQCDRCMSTGLNSTNLKDLKESLLSYLSGDHSEEDLKSLKKSSAESLCSMYEFKILKRKKKFKENY